MNTQVREIDRQDRRGFQDFLTVPERIYGDSSLYVRPLNAEVRSKLDPARNSFYKYGSVRLFVAYDNNGCACGRIAAIINPEHETLHGEKRGFFGLFECIDDTITAERLFDAAYKRLLAAGCDSILGPVNLSTNDESGFLLEGYDKRPTFMCNYCPPYYHDLMRACGFEKAIDTLSYEAMHGHPFPEKYYRLIRKLEARNGLTVRKFRKHEARADVLAIAEIYNASFRDTWGFVPLSSGEAVELADGLLPIADFDLIWIAEIDGAPVGAILGFPDINEILAKLNGRLLPCGFLRLLFGQRKITGMRIAALGVLPEHRTKGIETALIHRVHERVHHRPYQRAEFSVVMENNHPMRNLLERFGFTLCRRFRLYQRRIPEAS